MQTTTTYQPNICDPRVTNRIKNALGFSLGVLSASKPHQWSTRYIDKHFGSQANDLSKYLRGVLLDTTNSHYSMDSGKCKEYKLNQTGADYLREVLQGKTSANYTDYCNSKPRVDETSDLKKNSIPYPSVVHLSENAKFDYQLISTWCKREFGKELSELSFEYKDQSGRLWHPIQNIKREYKKPLLADAGLTYQYDVQCCAPTLIHQHAQEQGMDLYLFALNKYLSDRTAVRNELAEQAEVSVSIIKVLINALFCGARLGNNKDFALSQLLAHDTARIEFLKANEFITQLKSDIKVCWQYIEQSMTKTYVLNEETGTQRKKPQTSKAKWCRYFDLERRVLDAVRDYLKQTNNRSFLEHDGWVCEREINECELVAFVKSKTGYSIKIDKEILKTAI